MELELERGLEQFFKKIETTWHSSFSSVFYIAPLFLTLKEQL
jgi:hypothetical protein